MPEILNQTNPIWNLDFLDKFKNNALAILALTYGLGYLEWSIYAYSISLGAVSALDTQYIIAGAVPTALIICLTLLYRFNKNQEKIIDQKFNRRAKGLKKVIRFLLLNLQYFFLAISVLLILYDLFNTKFDPGLSVSIFLYLSFFAKGFEPIDSEIEFLKNRNVPFSILKSILKKHRIKEQRVRTTYQGCTMCFFIPLILWQWTKIFPNIPQELGGAKPKHCIMVSDKNIFNRDASNNKKDTANLYYSDVVTVYYFNSSVILFVETESDKTSNKQDSIEKTNPQLYYDFKEINRSNIQTIFWLANEGKEE